MGRHNGQKPPPGWETHLTGGNRQVPWGKGSLNGAGTLEAATPQVVEGKAGRGAVGGGALCVYFQLLLEKTGGAVWPRQALALSPRVLGVQVSF